MKVTWNSLFERIENDPLPHIGGFSPRLINSYFCGYEQARSFHNLPKIEGGLSLHQINRWFIDHAYKGPQGCASFCLLLTETESEALKLFFEFRRLAQKDKLSLETETEAVGAEDAWSMLDLLRSEAVRNRPAMYFGNEQWIQTLWAWWNGYVEAEREAGIENSADAAAFAGFDKWMGERYSFAHGANWGKIFEFLAMSNNASAFENFSDHLELFLEGGSPKEHTKRFQQFLDDAVAAALKEQDRINKKGRD